MRTTSVVRGGGTNNTPCQTVRLGTVLTRSRSGGVAASPSANWQVRHELSESESNDSSASTCA